MSGQPAVHYVDDEQMSSEGSVNAPVAPPRGSGEQSLRAQSPMTMATIPVTGLVPPAQTVQAGVARRSGTLSMSGAAATMEVVVAHMVPVDVLTRAETKQAFVEVSSALWGISSQHDEVRARMQSLVSGVETLCCARVADVEMTAQVQATLQRTLSASSSLEARLEQAESQQTQAKVAADEARVASERALQQAA